MAVSGTYKIGTILGNMIDLEEPPNSKYIRNELGTRTDGSPYISQYSEVEWSWEAIKQEDYSILYGYWNSSSPTVYIRTRIETGSSISYSNFSAIMHPPISEMDIGFRKNVTVKFTKVEAA